MNIFSEKGRKKIASPLLNGKICSFCASSKSYIMSSHLTQEQRYTIQALLQAGISRKIICEKIGKNKSVLSRELKRNADQRNGCYKADLAERKCQQRHQTKRKSVKFTEDIQQFVEGLIQEDYSPEQIVGFANRNQIACVSHERIYQHLWNNKRQGGKLYTHLRTQGKRYRKRGASKDKRGVITGRIDIEERPKIVDEKQRFGDLEIDLVIGKNHKKAILTINDRASGKAKIALLKSKSAKEVKQKTVEILTEWKPFLHTITSDNGKEFALHQEIAKALDIDYYFAKPYHSWERGANENYNGLLRQYFPKKYNFDLITSQRLKEVENKINDRPRKRLGYLSPNFVFSQIINNGGEKVAFMT